MVQVREAPNKEFFSVKKLEKMDKSIGEIFLPLSLIGSKPEPFGGKDKLKLKKKFLLSMSFVFVFVSVSSFQQRLEVRPSAVAQQLCCHMTSVCLHQKIMTLFPAQPKTFLTLSLSHTQLHTPSLSLSHPRTLYCCVWVRVCLLSFSHFAYLHLLHDFLLKFLFS